MLVSELKKLASTIPIGSTRYFNCPSCGRRDKIGMTKLPFSTVYRCFSSSCGIKGKLNSPMNKENLSSLLLNKGHTDALKRFILPDYLIKGFASVDSFTMALKYNLLDTYSQGLYETSFDPKLHRQVFFHTDTEGNIVGAMGRALRFRQTPKAHIYINSIKTPWICGTSTTGVIVEDILSAINVANVGLTGIALSGTTLHNDYIFQLAKFNTVIICLDKDASIKAIELKKTLDIVCKNVIIRLLSRDIKDMPIDELLELLKGY